MKHKVEHTTVLVMLLLAVVAASLMCFVSGMYNLAQSRGEEDRLQLETAVRKAVVACYAAEGFYPPNLDYLQQRYGVQINEKKYAVIYDVFGTNLMPDITVLERAQ